MNHAGICLVAVGLLMSSTGSAAVIEGVPTYHWYYGCAPTSAGMIVGYWDGLPGYGDLFDGDASVETQDTLDMIASPEHIADPFSQSHSKNSIADFMRTTIAGATGYDDIGPGVEQYIEWDNPLTAIDESYEAEVEVHDLELLFGDWDWDLYTSEIDAGRPVLLNLVAYIEGDILGHTVVGYGYQNDLFRISLVIDGEPTNVTVPGFAVRDTWPEGPAGALYWGWDGEPVEPIIDESGVEWWPWVEIGDGGPRDPHYEWLIYQGVTINIIPEPATVGLLAIPCLGAVLRRRAF